MATMHHLVKWNVHTTSSTLKLASPRFAPLGGIRSPGDGFKARKSSRLVVRAGPKKGGNSGDKARRYDPMFARDGGSSLGECPVPWEQQPVNEYQMLNETGLFAWATDPVLWFAIRLSAVTVGVAALVGYPIVSLSVSADDEFLKCVLGALCGGILAGTVVTLRLYLGWAYIGNRLFSATVEYEETGWYDGEVWVKPPEVLARDRLLGSYKVKPALVRMKVTLVALALSLLGLSGAIYALPGPPPHLEPAEDTTATSTLTYSESAARRYEPEAFDGDDDVSTSSAAAATTTAPALFDICQR